MTYPLLRQPGCGSSEVCGYWLVGKLSIGGNMRFALALVALTTASVFACSSDPPSSGGAGASGGAGGERGRGRQSFRRN